MTRQTIPAEPDKAAAYWKARQLSGNMTACEAASFRAWLATSPAHADAMAAYDDLDARITLAVRAEAAAELTALADKKAERRWFAGVSAAAAAVAALVAVPLVPDRGGADTFATTTGERRDVTLADGSVISLNAKSEIAVAYDDTARHVTLTRGEALFDVARDAARPFRVTGGASTTTVLGTQFNVSLRSDGADVAVLSGVVRVDGERAGEGAMLIAGQRTRVDAKGGIAPIAGFDPAQLLDWREGKARFVDAPLGEVVAELNLHFSRPLVPADAEVAAIPVTGTFDLQKPEVTIASLEAALGLKAVAAAGGTTRLEERAE